MQKKTDYSYLKHLDITVTFMVFDMHTDHLISARRPELIIINKTKGICKIVDFASIHGKKKNNQKTNNGKEKQLYGHFKQQTSKISHEMIWTWLKNWSFNRETEPLQIVA